MPQGRLSIDYTVQLWREGRQYVAHAMPLDVMSAGTTPEEARHALDEAVELFLKTAADTGTLEQVLEDAGYSEREDCWEGPAWVGVERHTLSVVA
jgi:predicted RNase H-like HicB family nuclease